MIVNLHKDFKKDFNKLSLKVKKKANERLMLFEQDKFDPILNNHILQGRYTGYRSINITGDLRAIYRKTSKEIMFVAINSHSNLYG